MLPVWRASTVTSHSLRLDTLRLDTLRRLGKAVRGPVARLAWRLEPPWSIRRRQPPGPDPILRVIVVCRGNYCRSPVAEEVLRTKLRTVGVASQVAVESAGTSGYYSGRHPHVLARSEARRRGLDISRHRSRVFDPRSLGRETVVVAVDELTRQQLLGEPFGLALADVRRLGDYGSSSGGDIRDPNGLDASVFASVHDQIEDACEGLAAEIAARVTARTPAA